MESQTVEGDTIEAAVRHVQSEVCTPGRLVVRLRFDGEDVSEEALASTLQKEVSSCSRLELFTSTKQALIGEAMNQASASLHETEETCRQVAGLLTEGKTQEGMQAFSDCLTVWRQVHRAVLQSIQMLDLDVDAMTVGDEPISAIIARPKEVLLQVREALRVDDHVLLADLLQYEFSDVTNQWFILIARIREEAESAV